MPRFSLKTLLIVVAVCAMFLSAWLYLFQEVIRVRPPRPDDRIGEMEMPWYQEGDEVRNIVFLEGNFSSSNRLFVSLVAVRAGTAEVQCESTLRRSQWDESTLPVVVETMLALRTRRSSGGVETFVDHRGDLVSAISGRSRLHQIPSTFKHVYSGSLTPGQAKIIYVEGSTVIEVSSGMTVEEFAKRNSGNYFVVIAELK